jgi:hypothetical protein
MHKPCILTQPHPAHTDSTRKLPLRIPSVEPTIPQPFNSSKRRRRCYPVADARPGTSTAIPSLLLHTTPALYHASLKTAKDLLCALGMY